MRRISLLSFIVLVSACGTAPSTTADGSVPIEIDSGDGDTSGASDAGGGSGAGDSGTASDTGADGGGADSGTTGDTSTDATGTDATGSDSTTFCIPGTTACEGATLLVCSDSGEGYGRRRCEADLVCGLDSTGTAACIDPGGVEPVCEPGALQCDPTGQSVVECLDDGSGFFVSERCAEGCNRVTAACNAPIGDRCDDFDLVELGEFNVDLCDLDDTTTLLPSADGECGDSSGEGNDYTFGFAVERAGTYSVEALDDDGSVAIDPIVALRGICDDVETQFACHDDLPCDEADFDTDTCSGDSQPRHARIIVDLEPGTYWVVVDHFEYNSGAGNFDCGNVLVRVTAL